MNAVVDDTQLIAHAILDIIFKRRRLLAEEVDLLPGSILPDEQRPHLEKIAAMVAAHQPIEMILPAFPGKSPNRNKTLGQLPDLAERHSLANLHTMLQEIASLYSPGGMIRICSDGYVFADLVRIPDPEVEGYVSELARHTRHYFGGAFQYFDLIDAYPDLPSMDARREEMLIDHAEPLRCLRLRCSEEPEAIAMYRGTTRFLFEDYQGLADFATWSKTRIQQHARTIAYRVIQRSNAWSALLEQRFPHALRLSIHPQYRISKKIGINMIATDDCWRTPWHSVAVCRAGEVYLERRSTIDENQAVLVFERGRPSYYQLMAV
ncbi:isocyanide synthase family protein [Chitinivorax sp. B]|uniref:isocyanide synthase family protein n=1 Tax=Chitinivorax sp. B TaxID=2502235 RepID=UPI0010F6B519|nr:isocyanide synthase family protein [Chitinivorax sp. B]